MKKYSYIEAVSRAFNDNGIDFYNNTESVKPINFTTEEFIVEFISFSSDEFSVKLTLIETLEAIIIDAECRYYDDCSIWNFNYRVTYEGDEKVYKY